MATFTPQQVAQFAKQSDPSLPQQVADQLGGTMVHESSGDPQSVSSAGALGLLQIEPATAQAAGVASDRTHLFDPAYNVYAALKVLCLQGSVAWGGSGTWVGPTYPPKKYGCNAQPPGSQTQTGAGGNTQPQQSQYLFTRGTAENPDEDSYTAACRLAQEVAWFFFPDGPRVYFMDGPDMIAQKPVVTLDRVRNRDVIPRIDGTFDNTSLQFRSTHKTKSTKVQRKTGTAKPSSPTQIKVDVVCAPLDYRGGEVVMLQGFGFLDGPWVVSDATRDIFQTYSELTLSPPTAPIPEPASSSTSGTQSGGVGTGVGGYVNPFKNAHVNSERVDMGVDFSGSGDILAIGNADVFNAMSGGSGWTSPMNTQAFVGYTLKDGQYQGKHIFVAEDITIKVKTGQTVKAGDPIATFISSSPTGIETGWASGQSAGALASSLNQQAPGDPGAWMSAAGSSFSNFLKSLGAPAGIRSGSVHGTMPPGYPPA